MGPQRRRGVYVREGTGSARLPVVRCWGEETAQWVVLPKDMNHALRGLGPVLFHQLLQIDPVEELHDVIKRPVLPGAVIVNVDGVR